MLNVPLTSQNDPNWKDLFLGYGSGDIGTYGCLLASFTAILNYYTMQDWQVDEVNDLMKQWGGYSGETKNLWGWKVAEKFGLTYSLNHSWSYDDAEVKKWIAKGVPVILKVDGKPLGGLSHYIVAIGDGKVMDSWDGQIKPFSSYTPLGYHIYTYEGKPTMSPTQSELQTYLGVDSDDAAKSRLKEHLGEYENKCDWGNEAEKRGGYLGAERRNAKAIASNKLAVERSLKLLENQLISVEYLYESALEDLYQYATECFLYQDDLIDAEKIKERNGMLVDPTSFGSSKLLMLTITAFVNENLPTFKKIFQKLKGGINGN